MKKLILYGVRQWEMRRDIEHFLDDDYKIIGYSDGHYTSDLLDGSHFISPEQLPNTEFDYIMLLSLKESTLADMRSTLLAQGVPPDKIIRPTMFLSGGARRMIQADLIGDIEARYQGEEGLIFGPSASFLGIIEKKLRPAFFDCSWYGVDLYYYYRIFQYMRRRGLLSRVKTVLLVLHHHWFSYDMSRSMALYTRPDRIFALRRLDDWHNYRKAPEAPDYVTNFRMFGRKVSEYYHIPKDFHKYEYPDQEIYQGKDGEADMRGPWCRDYPETLAENTALFADFCREMAEAEITPIVVIAPWYVNGMSQAALEYGRKRKQEFYQAVGSPPGGGGGG